jgi:hypothetical protein
VNSESVCTSVDRSNTDHLSEVRKNTHRILVGKPAGKDNTKDSGVSGRIILKFV